MTDEELVNALEERDAPKKIELPKERILPIFLRYKEPKSPITNRAERRLVEHQLLLIAKHEITKHLKEVGKTFGQETR